MQLFEINADDVKKFGKGGGVKTTPMSVKPVDLKIIDDSSMALQIRSLPFNVINGF